MAVQPPAPAGLSVSLTSDSSPLPLPVDGDRDGRWMDHLSSLYQLEFSLLTVAAGVAAIGSPLVVTFLNQLPPACRAANEGRPEVATDCLATWQLMLTPMVPLLLLMAFGYLYFYSRVVGSYTRDLERTISGDVKSPGQRLSIPALSRLNGALFGGESASMLPLRVFFALLSGTVALISGAAAVFPITRINDLQWKVTGAVLYGVMGLVCLLAYNAAASHQLHRRLRAVVKKRDKDKAATAATPGESKYWPWSRFLLFLVVPRYASVMKEVHAIAIAVAVASVSGRFLEVSWGRFALGMVIFEGVLYQTRYLLNGVREDPRAGPQLPSNRNDRPRSFTALQGFTALLVAAARMYAFYILVTTLHLLSGRSALLLVVLFVAAFYAYEGPREVARQRYRALMTPPSWDSQKPLPQTELRDLCSDQLRMAPFMFVAVGAGYAVRALAALLLVSGGRFSLLPYGVAVVVAWLLGSALVGAGWAREFTGATSPAAAPRVLHPGVAAKPHVLWMGRIPYPTDLTSVAFELMPLDGTNCKDATPLGAHPSARRSPWRAACAMSIAGLGLFVPAGASISVPLVVLMLGLALYTWLDGPELLWWPPVVPGVAVLGCAVLVLTSSVTWWWALGVAGMSVFVCVVMTMNERNALDALLPTGAAAPPSGADRSYLMTTARTLAEVVLGGALVRSAPKIFGRDS